MRWTDAACEELLQTGREFALGESGHVVRFTSSDKDAFNTRWTEHPKPQATSANWKLLAEPASLQGLTVLDAGCGCGRFLSAVIEAGAERVIGVDISPAAISAAKALVPEAAFIETHLFDIPVRDAMIDFAYSIGVLHHTPDTFTAFKELARTVKPGGRLCVWLYVNAEPPMVDAAMALLHDITRCCPRQALYDAIKKHAVRVRDLYNKEWGPLQQVLRVSISEDDEECISDTFDWHGPDYRYRHTNEEVSEWFNSCGFDVLKVGPFPVNILGRKR